MSLLTKTDIAVTTNELQKPLLLLQPTVLCTLISYFTTGCIKRLLMSMNINVKLWPALSIIGGALATSPWSTSFCLSHLSTTTVQLINVTPSRQEDLPGLHVILKFSQHLSDKYSDLAKPAATTRKSYTESWFTPKYHCCVVPLNTGHLPGHKMLH